MAKIYICDRCKKETAYLIELYSSPDVESVCVECYKALPRIERLNELSIRQSKALDNVLRRILPSDCGKS